MVRTLRPVDVYPITTRTLDVLRVADVTPGMRRVTLGGAELAAHTAANGFPVAAFRSDGFDDEFKLILQHPEAATVVGPTQADGVLSWPRGDAHLLLRTYTVRRWDPVAGEVDVDVVRHGVGPATRWAEQARPGDRIQVAGPKMSAPHPVRADSTLVAGDETALPAIGRWLEEWPAGARGQVFVEVAEPGHRQELPVPDGVELTWLSRDGARPGTTTLLLDAIRSAPWPDGVVFAWVAGEALTLAPIRRWLRDERGLPREQLEVTGYWRRQETTDGGPVEQADEDDDRLHELTELVPGFALRVAATLGLTAAIGADARPVAALARTTGTDPDGLRRLLRYLTSIGLTEQVGPDAVRLAGLGRALDDDMLDRLRLDRAPALRELDGLVLLLDAVRTGRPGGVGGNGGDGGADPDGAGLVPADDAVLADQLDDEDQEAAWSAGALATAPELTGARSLVVAGPGAGSHAAALVAAHPDLEVVVVAAPSELAHLRALHDPHPRVRHEAGSPLHRRAARVDVLLLAGVLDALPDADAVHVLREAAASLRPDGRLLVLDELLDPELADEHDYADDLVAFALTGGGSRTHEEHLALLAAAGLGTPRRSTIGWGQTLYTVRAADR
ncbi:MAG TPA: siderophore-interacting protein [Cellulomonas sp.]